MILWTSGRTSGFGVLRIMSTLPSVFLIYIEKAKRASCGFSAASVRVWWARGCRTGAFLGVHGLKGDSAVGKQIPWCWVLPLPLQQLNFLPLLGFPLPLSCFLVGFPAAFSYPHNCSWHSCLNSAAFATLNCLWLYNLWLQVPLSLLFLPTSPAVQLQVMHREIHTARCDKAEFVPAEIFFVLVVLNVLCVLFPATSALLAGQGFA